MKKIGISLLTLVCIYALLSVIGELYAYKEIKKDGYLIGVIDAMCLNCDTNEEYYSLLYKEGNVKEASTILVSKTLLEEETNFYQGDCIYTEFNEYKISRNEKEIIIESPIVLTEVISKER